MPLYILNRFMKEERPLLKDEERKGADADLPDGSIGDPADDSPRKRHGRISPEAFASLATKPQAHGISGSRSKVHQKLLFHSTSLATGEENLTEEANYKTTGGESVQKGKSPNEAVATLGRKTGKKGTKPGNNEREEMEKRMTAPKRHG